MVRLQSSEHTLMKRFILAALFLFSAVSLNAAPVPLFDGKTLAGWECNAKLWSVQDGCLTGGSLSQTVARNEYVIRAEGPRIQTWINGVQGTDFTEADPNIPDWGKLGIQIHGGGKAMVQVKDITIEELPPTLPGKIFRGAPEPKKAAKASP